jgi:pyruvate dehydrogenase E2 component (dihydrolipoamide acetyltransferase)
MTELSLPIAVGAALDDPPAPQPHEVDAAGIHWAARSWGAPIDRPLLLIHGVTSSGAVWWRVGPALAATGRWVIAVDLPGHGGTRPWVGHHRFRDNARDVIAFLEAAGVDTSALQVVGHSWGAMTAAALPVAGLRPDTIVLLDPPAVPYDYIAAQVEAADSQAYPDLETAAAAVRVENPDWDDRDVEAKAEALVELDAAAARSVLLDNHDWDGGVADLRDPAASGVSVYVIRGEPAAGGYLPDAAAETLEAIIGAGRVHTIHGAPHSPQRTHPVETTAAILHALED